MFDLRDKILLTISIENYIGKFVQLKKRGKYLVGLCPFHKEKTPSFTVTPELGIFYCFGCGKGGNLFNFVMEKEKVSFREALEILSSYAGIQIQNFNSQDSRYINLLNFLNQIFREYLFSEEGKIYLDYIRNRGIDLTYITKFQIGASPHSVDWILSKFSTEEKYNKTNDLLEVGIFKKNHQNEYYNFFRGRVLFPIFDLKNNTIGFGGRSISESETPKYLNSPESNYFHKGSILYGLNFAKETMKKYNEVFVTEGYLDVIGLHQIGIENVVAPLGTAFTQEHKKLLQRYAKNIYLLLDGDFAGRKAILRILSFFQEDWKDIYIILLPEGLDPYDWSLQIKLGKESKEIFLSSKENALNAFEFIFFYLFLPDNKKYSFLTEKNVAELNSKIKQFANLEALKNYYFSLSLQEKQSLLEQGRNFFVDFQNEVFRELFLQEWKAITQIDLKNFFSDSTKKSNYENHQISKKEIDDSQQEILITIERKLIAYLLKNPKMTTIFSEELSNLIFYDEFSLLVYRTLYEHYMIQNKDINIGVFLSNFSSEAQQIFASYLLEDYTNLYEFQKDKNTNTDIKFENIIKELLIRHKIEEIDNQIRLKEKEINFTQGELKHNLFKEIDQLIKEKKQLKRYFKETFK